MRSTILFLLAACNAVPKYDTCENATFWLSDGLACVDTHNLPEGETVDQDDAQRIFDEAFNRYVELYPEDASKILDSLRAMPQEIVFHDTMRGNRLGGSVAKTTELVYKPCLGNTAMGHELLHQFRRMGKGDGDGQHSDVALFQSGNFYEQYVSVENRINRTVCEDMCGDCDWGMASMGSCTYDDSCPPGFLEVCAPYYPFDCFDQL